MLFLPVFDKASKPDRTSLQPHPSPTKNRHAPQQTGLRPDHCATQPHSTLFVSNQQVFRVARKCVPMLGALADFPSCPPPGQRSSQCECFTLCLLSTAGLVGSRKLLSSSSSTFKLAVRMTGSSTGADRRAQESVTPSRWTSRGRSSWRAHARMALSAATNGSLRFDCCRPNFVDKVAMPGMWRDAHSSTAGCSRVPKIPAGSVTDGLHSPPNGTSQQTAAEGKTRIKALEQMLKSAREPQDHGCTSTRSKSKQRGTPSWRVPGQRAGLGWVKASLLRDHQAMATAQDKVAATQTLLREATQRMAPLWIVRCGIQVLHLEWHLSPLHRRLALAHQFHNSRGSNDRKSR